MTQRLETRYRLNKIAIGAVGERPGRFDSMMAEAQSEGRSLVDEPAGTSDSLHDAITADYLNITVRGSSSTASQLAFSADGFGRWLEGWLPTSPTAAAIDLGCGTGPLLFLLQRRGITNLIGVDLCQGELDVARQHVAAELHLQDVLTYLKSAAANSAELICAMNILEHLPKDVLFGTLKECRRVLKPGGALVAMVPNAQSPFGGMTRYWDLTHHTAFTPSSVRQLAGACGFLAKDVQFRECGPRPHGFKSVIRSVLWQAIRMCIAAWLLIETSTTKSGIYTSDMLFRIIKTEAENDG